MKSTINLFLAITTITLAVVCVMQTRKFGGQQAQLASLRTELDQKAQQVETLQAAQKHFDQQRHELMAQADELATQLQARKADEVNIAVAAPALPLPVAKDAKPDDEKGGFGKMFSKMMQDPDTKKLIRQTQKMMMDQMYAPLMKKLALTPEESAQFKTMLTDNAMKAADNAGSIFGALASTNNAEALKTLTADQQTFDEQVKDFLGDDRYAQYKEYGATLGERMLLKQFKQQAGSDYNLNEQQSEALLNLMKEEKKNVAASTGLPLEDDNKNPAKLQALMSGDKMEEIFKAQDTVNQRVYDRARTFLSPDQLETWGKFQTNQAQMMRMGVGMMKTMFGTDKSSPAAPSDPAASGNP